ncbi:MAG: histidine kinase [Solirubrobacteraceae bacterium]
MPDDCRHTTDDLPFFQPGVRPATRSARLMKLTLLALSMGWLAIPVVDLLTARVGVGRTAGALAAFAVWLAVYFTGVVGPMRLTTRDAFAWAGTLTVMATALTCLERSSWATLYVYCAVAGAMALDPARYAIRWVVGVTALCAATLTIGQAPDSALVSLTVTTLSIGFLMFAFGRLIRANRELREAREELAERAVDQERLRFARDLHDLLGHNLSVIALKAQLARRVLDRDLELARREIADVEEVTRTALAEVREAVSGYRRPTLANELAGARSALDAAGIACTVEHPQVSLPPNGEEVLAWGVREATTNVIRHSGAHHCEIRILVGLDEAALEVTDDGPAPTPGASDGTGLRGLAERAAAAGGRVIAGPRPGGGFGLELRVPLGRTA